MSDWGPPNGYAIRRHGSCAQEEKDSGETINGFHQCCPGGTDSPNGTGACCKGPGICTERINDPPHCANETWTLFENIEEGYFCCESGMDGYNVSRGVGCEDRRNDTDSNEKWWSSAYWLPTVASGVAESTGGVTSTTATATATSEPESDGSGNSSSGSNPAGPIAGGVVGGVAGLAIIIALIWYFIRRQSQKQKGVPVTEPPMVQFSPNQFPNQPSELDGQHVAELSSNQPVHELPGHPVTK